MDIIRGLTGEYDQWREALGSLDENPLFFWLESGRQRRWQSLPWTKRWLPLLIGLVLTLLFITFAIIESINTHTNEYLMLFKIACLVFIGSAYLVWAITGLAGAIMDVLSVLGDNRSQTFRLQLDDLAAITSLTDVDIAAGILRLVMPPLYLRILAGSGLIWLMYFLVLTGMLEHFSNDSAVMLATAGLVTFCWGLFGCLGATALILFYLAMGYGHGSITGAVAVTSTLISQGIWLMIAIGLGVAMFQGGGPWTSSDNSAIAVILPFSGSMVVTTVIHYSVEEALFLLSILVGPLLFAYLIYTSLEFCRRRPPYRLLYGAIGPLTNPLLLIIAGIILFSMFEMYDMFLFDTDLWYIPFMGFLWQFGNMLPLNPSSFTMTAFLTGDLHQLTDVPFWMHLPLPMILLAQLALVLICARYARIAVGTRRQGSG